MVSLLFFITFSITMLYTLSLHDALPILPPPARLPAVPTASMRPPASRTSTVLPSVSRAPHSRRPGPSDRPDDAAPDEEDRKSTRLNSSHPSNSYAVFCMKKKLD